ncbi:MAG: hypothetical protein QOK02_1405 [Mycobacterium sp.]|jgi:hypothetical protein|nr:hypothetical protein [Mycobacterium sp.]
MTTTTKQSAADKLNTTFEFPSVEEATQRMRDLNQRIIDSSKSAGLVALDTFEKAMHSVEEFQQQITSASQLDWMSEAAKTQSKFVSEMTSSYTAAVRDLLK